MTKHDLCPFPHKSPQKPLERALCFSKIHTRFKMKQLFFLATLFVATCFFMSCEKDDKPNETPSPQVEDNNSYGTSVKLANGTAKTFIKHDAAGVPLEIGVAISEAAIGSLPLVNADLVLDLPASHAKMPFKFVHLNYLPDGNSPNGAYNKANFDVRFYTVDKTVRTSITTAADPRLMHFPVSDKIPANYVFKAATPLVGAIWADATAAEYQGQPFSTTYFYGSLDGEMIFHAPKVAIEYLKKRENKMFPIVRPHST